MRILNKFLFCIIIAASTSAFADNDRFRDYDADYYLDEGKLLFKLRPLYSIVEAKQKDLDRLSSSNPSAKKPSDLVENGYGFDTTSTYFLADHIAAELSAGVTYYKTKRNSLRETANLFGNNNATVGKKSDLWMVPVSATLQYHIAPFGALRPYLGVGAHGTYVYSRAKEFSVNSGFGAVFQGGVDFVARDDTLITLDVRGYTFESKINYKKEFTGTGQDFSSKVKWNPVVISLGFGFIF